MKPFMIFNVIYQQFIAKYDVAIVRSTVTGPDSNRDLMSKHTEVPCRR